MRGGLWLARMLEERYPTVREAFAEGGLGEEQARIIVRTAEQMPPFVPEAIASRPCARWSPRPWSNSSTPSACAGGRGGCSTS